MNYVLTACHKKENHHCKNWDGKGNIALVEQEVREHCANEPDTCKFLAKPIPRTGCEWVWQTIAGKPATTVEQPAEQPKESSKPPSKKPPAKVATETAKVANRTCADCEEDATHMIAGYKPTYLCILHGEKAQADGFRVEEIEHATE